MNKISKEQLLEKLKTIEIVFLDADGTLTDGGMYLNENLIAIKKFYAHDGTGIAMIRNIGLKVVLLTTSKSPIMVERAKILQLDDCITGSDDKGKHVLQTCKKFNISPKNTLYVGDDVNDILAFKEVGLPIAVKNSAPAIFDFVVYITEKKGGKGAIREICDLILLAKTGKLYGAPYVPHYIQ